MPFPCHAVFFQLDFHSAALFDSQLSCRAHAAPVPCHDLAVLKATYQGHDTVRRGHGMPCVNYQRPSGDGMWENYPRSASSEYHAEFHEVCYRKHTNPLNCRTSSSDISGYHTEFHEGCYQKHTNPLNCRTSCSDISGYHADFHEGHGTVGEWQGRGMACVM
jgi:hypothetical protein